MIKSCIKGIKISGISAAVPKEREILSEKFSELFGEKAMAKFSQTAGVIERRIAKEEQTSSDLAFIAAVDLLEKKGVSADEIGAIIFVTQTPDYREPATACVLHKRLNLPIDCIAFDVNLGCSGYVNGIQIAASLLQSINSKYALLLVGDTSNKVVSPEDKSQIMLFGDSGSATLIEKTEEDVCIDSAFRTDGKGFKAIIIPAGAYRNRNASRERVLWGDGNVRSDWDAYMNGMNVFAFAISEVPKLINEFLASIGKDRDDYDSCVFHQANYYMIKQLVKRCKLPADRIPISMDRYGNTSVTSIPLTICDAYGKSEDEGIKKLLLCGFGVGLSWGVVSLEIDTKDVFPVIESDDYFEDGAVSHD